MFPIKIPVLLNVAPCRQPSKRVESPSVIVLALPSKSTFTGSLFFTHLSLLCFASRWIMYKSIFILYISPSTASPYLLQSATLLRPLRFLSFRLDLKNGALETSLLLTALLRSVPLAHSLPLHYPLVMPFKNSLQGSNLIYPAVLTSSGSLRSLVPGPWLPIHISIHEYMFFFMSVQNIPKSLSCIALPGNCVS